MADKKYRALFVLEPTHNKVAVEAKKMRMTIDRLVSDMLHIYEKRKQEVK
jgi:hypothetical protein